ncbi:MFS transporter [Streptomyces sp. NPDC001480]|uniref:MFS transporter n=1 Tax=Streptomyces sp. NPDC001480 TaxID=3364577 RepID=UPI00368FF0A7
MRTRPTATTNRRGGPTSPLRVLAAGQAITAAGDGAWLTVWTIYLTRFGGLSASEFAVGATAGGALALLIGVPLGRLADRLGPRRILVALTLVSGIALAAFLGVRNFWTFLPVALVANACDKARVGVFQVYVMGLARRRERVAELGKQQAARSVGFTLGGALGGVVLALGSLPAFVVLILANFTTNILYAVILLRLPPTVPPARDSAHRNTRVLRDVPFVSIAVAGGVLTLGWSLLSTGVPLWMTHHTDVPPWTAGALVVLNGVLVALLQARAARADNSRRTATRKVLSSAVVLGVACLLFALTGVVHGRVAMLVALAAGCVHAAAEVIFVAAFWGLSVALMPEDAAGEYQSVASIGTAAASVLAPLVVVPLVVGIGATGWVLLAGVFVLAGAATVPLSAWAAGRPSHQETARHTAVENPDGPPRPSAGAC